MCVRTTAVLVHQAMFPLRDFSRWSAGRSWIHFCVLLNELCQCNCTDERVAAVTGWDTAVHATFEAVKVVMGVSQVALVESLVVSYCFQWK